MEHPDENVRAFVGPNADYYLKAWAAVDAAGGPQPLGWNWAAFFLNLIWLLYRRMYKYFAIAFAALFGLAVVQVVLQVSLGGIIQWFSYALNFAICLAFGAYGNWLYYQHTMWTISQTKAHHASPDAIARAGGVRLMWPVLLFVVPMVIGMLAAIMLPKVLQSAH